MATAYRSLSEIRYVVLIPKYKKYVFVGKQDAK